MESAAGAMVSSCRLLVLLCVAFIVLVAVNNVVGVGAATVPYRFKVAYMNAAPDCYSKTIIGINGGYPGPTINVTEGDTLEVTFENHIATEGITMHWHGIRQINSPWADGTASVSQCAIAFGETFTYKFVVDRPGTYFYHGHFGCQRAAGFYGSLIVNALAPEPYRNDYTRDEHMIIVNDWWHKPVADQEQGLESQNFSWVGEPQSLLLEGRGKYDCTKVGVSDEVKKVLGIKCNSADDRCDPYIMKVTRDQTYRLRLASVASLSALNFHIEGHNMTVVEADGHSVQPFVTSNLNLYSGETYSVLVTANSTETGRETFHIALNVIGREDETVPTGLGILTYNPDNKASPTTPVPRSPNFSIPAWNDWAAHVAQARLYKARADPTSHPYDNVEMNNFKTLKLLTTQNTYNSKVRWAINNVTFEPTSTPLLAALVHDKTAEFQLTRPDDFSYPAEYGWPPTTYPAGYDIRVPSDYKETYKYASAYMFETNDVVNIIIQNANTNQKDKSEIHPWHLHGHDFYILGYGDGVYDVITSEAKLNVVDPPLRNNVPVFPWGWTVIRTKLDNPGAWPFHCHIEWHFHLGMGVMIAHGIEELQKDKAKNCPASTMGCGLTKGLIPETP